MNSVCEKIVQNYFQLSKLNNFHMKIVILSSEKNLLISFSFTKEENNCCFSKIVIKYW